MLKHCKTIALIVTLLLLSACESTYYSAMEEIGYHKRDILIDRIEDAQLAQEEGQQQFKSALEQFKATVDFDGGELESVYQSLNDEYENSVDAAENISERIDKVDSVASALFDEWQQELDLYTSANLRRDSQQQLKATQRRYQNLLTSMRKAEKTIAPVLNILRDNTLYLKHNLNARAITSLKAELGNINNNVTKLINAMELAIQESDKFIGELKKG